MKRILIPLLLYIFFISCKEKQSKNKLIDVGPFTITVPNNFEYKKLRGIDSFVGEITDGKSTFSFDYGMYSPEPPLTKNELLKEHSKTIDLSSLHQLLKKINITSYQDDDGSINLKEINKRIKNLELKENTEHMKFSMYPDKKFKYYYSLKFDNKQYNIPFFAYEVYQNNFKNFVIKTDTIHNHKRTISIYKRKDISEHCSVYLKNIKEDSRYGTLWFRIPANHNLSEEQVETILYSVTMKNK